jgi:hypothetical protein
VLNKHKDRNTPVGFLRVWGKGTVSETHTKTQTLGKGMGFEGVGLGSVQETLGKPLQITIHWSQYARLSWTLTAKSCFC